MCTSCSQKYVTNQTYGVLKSRPTRRGVIKAPKKVKQVEGESLSPADSQQPVAGETGPANNQSE